MKKVTLLFLFLSSLLFSEKTEQFPFIGINISTQNITILDETSRETAIGLRIGRQTMDWRTLFSYEYSKGYQALSVEVDKILLDSLFNTAKTRPYLGASAGALLFEDKQLIEAKGYYFGANLGFILYATDSMDLDISYHYNWVQNIEEIDTMHGATLSLHYFF